MPTWLIVLIGALAAVVTLASNIVTVFVLYRSKNAEIIKAEMEAYRLRAERLDREKQTDTQELNELRLKVADLEARTDLSEIRKGQAAIMELIAKQSSAILENQTNGMKMAHEFQQAMSALNAAAVQTVVTLEKMEKRLDQGLIMR